MDLRWLFYSCVTSSFGRQNRQCWERTEGHNSQSGVCERVRAWCVLKQRPPVPGCQQKKSQPTTDACVNGSVHAMTSSGWNTGNGNVCVTWMCSNFQSDCCVCAHSHAFTHTHTRPQTGWWPSRVCRVIVGMQEVSQTPKQCQKSTSFH